MVSVHQNMFYACKPIHIGQKMLRLNEMCLKYKINNLKSIEELYHALSKIGLNIFIHLLFLKMHYNGKEQI